MSISPAARDSCGYHGPLYASSLIHLGSPLEMSASGGWGLLRSISGTASHDVSGPYPVYVCRHWEALAEDIEMLHGRAVSIVLVTDPFAPTDEDRLKPLFPDLCRVFKEHYVVDLDSEGSVAGPARHHRRQARLGLAKTSVEISAEPAGWLQDWNRLYDHLVRRHTITGAAAFPASSFTRQLAIPGMVAARAISGETTVGLQLWAIGDGGDTASYHLGACDSAGYACRASYALTASMLQWLARMGVRRVALGAGAGAGGSSAGLDRFKAGWATRTAPVYLCGRILDSDAYTDACRSRGGEHPWFFPAYRTP